MNNTNEKILSIWYPVEGFELTTSRSRVSTHKQYKNYLVADSVNKFSVKFYSTINLKHSDWLFEDIKPISLSIGPGPMGTKVLNGRLMLNYSKKEFERSWSSLSEVYELYQAE